MTHAIEYSRNTNNKEERDLIDAIFEVSAVANKEVIEELVRGGGNMCQALMEIMKPEIDEIVNIAVLQERERVEKETAERVEKENERKIKETAERAIKAAVRSLRRFNASDTDIKAALIEDYGLSEQEALSYLK